ncbi:MAG: Dabb family protein [Boseongicola sp.]|nr:Dabb family protein [Boseongicola sp.]NNL19434.1 Dabb family protein [Boseongicola sp.]
MLRHIVLSTFKADASEEQLEAWRTAVKEMCKTSDEVVSFTLGANIGSGPNHHDSALVADFKDLESFRSYIASPAHKAYVENHAKHVVEKLAAVQHEI